MENKFIRFLSSSRLQDISDRSEPTYTRTISSKLGLFGFMGFLGFLGFVPHLSQMPFVFFFFSFFGFFGFYYEGKISNTLMDERFILNAYRAEALANKIGLMMIILSTILWVCKIERIENVAGFLLAIIGLAFGLVGFLQQYLLYRFENEE